MRVFFIGDDRNIEEEMLRVDDGSMVLVGFEANIDIDLVKELEGESLILKKLSKFSRRKNLVLIIGIKASIYRRKYKSVAVIDRGKIIGISDETHFVNLDENYFAGTSYRVYKTSVGAIGIIVGSDILFPEVARALSTHKSEFLVTLAGRIGNYDAKTLLCAHSTFNGIMTFSIVGNSGIVTSRDGFLLLSKKAKFLDDDFVISRDRRLLLALRRDIYDNIYIEE